MTASRGLSKPVRSLGDFFLMALETLILIFRRPFAWREILIQSWFVARGVTTPDAAAGHPLHGSGGLHRQLFADYSRAADYSGVGAGEGTVTQIEPIVTALAASGTETTAMCADLGACSIREELDALRVIGVNPIQALVVPRVLAADRSPR